MRFIATIEDGGFNADVALPAIENHAKANIAFKFIAHMLRSRRTDMTETVGRRRRHATFALFECAQQGLRNRVRRTAQTSSPAGDSIQHVPLF